MFAKPDKVLVIGASGQIGRLLLPELSAYAHSVAAICRNPSALETSAIEVHQADLEGDFGHCFTGCDSVIFTAGSGAGTGLDKTLLIDFWGARKAIDLAKDHGVKHFIMVSSRGADNPDLGPAAIKPYLVAKHFADQYLIESDLTYTILRPGRLTNDAETGLFTSARPADPSKQVITRADTARAILACIGNTEAHNQTIELYFGDKPLSKIIGTH